MPISQEKIVDNPHLLLRLSVKELDRHLNSNPDLFSYDFGNGDNLLHALIRSKRNFQAISYLISRGHNLTTAEGINCATLSPIDLSAQNNSGKTAIQLTEELFAVRNIPKVVNILSDIKAAIQAAQTNTLDDFFSQTKVHQRIMRDVTVKHDPITADDGTVAISLAQAEVNTTIPPLEINKIRDQSRKSLTWNAPHLLEKEHEHIAPHYPNFNKEWSARNPDNLGKRAFILAYKNDDFIEMQAAIQNYQIEFEPNNTLSHLAYEAANQKHLYMVNYLIRKGYVDPNYKPDGETQTIQEKFDIARDEGMHLFQEAHSLNNLRKMENIILDYQLVFPEEEAKKFAYIAASKDRFDMLIHLLDTNEEIRNSALNYTMEGGTKSLKEMLNRKVFSLFLKKDFNTAETILTKYHLELPKTSAELAAYKAIDAGHLDMAYYLIDRAQIPPDFTLRGEKISIGEKLQQKRIAIGIDKFKNARANKDFPAMEHALLEYNLILPRPDSSKLAYRAADHGCLDMVEYLLKKGGADSSYRPNDIAPTLQEKSIQKFTEMQAKKATKKTQELMAMHNLDALPPVPPTTKGSVKSILKKR